MMKENQENKKEKQTKRSTNQKSNKKSTKEQPRKTMRKSEKRLILILIVITIILTAIYFVVINKGKTEELDGNNNNSQIQDQGKENFSILEDGTKLNISKKIKETKKIDGLEFSDMEITEKDNVTVILANVRNTTKDIKKDYIVDIKVLDKKGNEITSLSGYIGEIKSNETISFKTSATFDFANAYDIVITKK